MIGWGGQFKDLARKLADADTASTGLRVVVLMDEAEYDGLRMEALKDSAVYGDWYGHAVAPPFQPNHIIRVMGVDVFCEAAEMTSLRRDRKRLSEIDQAVKTMRELVGL